MNKRTFTTRTLLALTLVVAITAFVWPRPDPSAPDPKWRETLRDRSQPLWNVPKISLASSSNGKKFVTVTNTGRTTLQYRGESPTHITLHQEIHNGSNWQQDAWSADGMCEEDFEIAPGESVELEVEFWDDNKTVRMLGKFSEKATNRSGLVVLATSSKPDKVREN